MFSAMKDELRAGRLPDQVRLTARFDAAMVKKTAVLSLPPAFWSQDPKINPRAADLVLAALTLGSAARLALAEGALWLRKTSPQGECASRNCGRFC